MNLLEGFSPPDAEGVCSKPLQAPGSRARVQRRLRRSAALQPQAIDTWPADWLALLHGWLSAGSAHSRWPTLKSQAGQQSELAEILAVSLLRAGHVELREQHTPRFDPPWQIEQLRWLHPHVLRSSLGMPDVQALDAAAASALASPPESPLFADAWQALAQLPNSRIPTRAALLHTLARWQQEARSGARADFAHFARGDTKAIASSEWDWLDANLPMETLSVSRHAAVLWLQARFALHGAAGVLDLAALPHFIALPVAALAGFTRASQQPAQWTLIENRTSFERHARQSTVDEAVLWLPGQPPSAWREGFARLLALAPAPVRIACDPDPAGIDIALAAGAVAQACDVGWQPWKMSSADLLALSATKALSADDHTRLARLAHTALPDTLATLVHTLQSIGRKGEQEGYL